MTKILKYLVLLYCCFFVGFTCYASAVNFNKKYEKIFFPKGMPIIKNWNGKSRQERFEFYTYSKLSDNCEVVVFAEQTSTDSYDTDHRVWMGVVLYHDGSHKIIYLKDITYCIPVDSGFPGSFNRMNAISEVVNLNKSINLLHINIWAVLSGSGYISGASDLFFVCGLNDVPKNALEVLNASDFSREGLIDRAIKSSEFYLSIKNSIVCLYIVKNNIIFSQKGMHASSKKLGVYLLAKNKFIDSGNIKSLPPDALKLKSVPELLKLKTNIN